MVGRKPIGEKAMSAAERQRRKRSLEAAQAERTNQALERLSEASGILGGLWNRLNGNEKFRDVHDEIGRASRLCGSARFLLEPVHHLPVSKDDPRRLICGSTDYEHVANSLTITLIHEERRCPECMRQRRKFYPSA